MRWTDLLFAHWPVRAADVAARLPPGLMLDRFDGAAWIGVIPFRMEQVHFRGAPVLPGHEHFLEMNVRTYVRDEKTGSAGVYFFSLDTNSVVAAVGARAGYRLPYYVARMNVEVSFDEIRYRSERLFSVERAVLAARYRAAGFENALPAAKPGSIEHFLTERYTLFTFSSGRVIRGDIQHRQWILQPAEAEFRDLSVAAAQGFRFADTRPLLHYSEVQDMLAWPPRIVGG
jgi:uncharacterized protein YqjF (DUF2071 family)